MVSVSFPNRPFNLRDNVWFMQSDVANNRSLVGWELWVDKRSYSPTQSSGLAARWMRLNGGYVHEYYGNGFNFVNGNNFLLANGTAWIPHNADGTKSLLIEASAQFDILGSTTLSVMINLPTIPRASVISFTTPAYDNLTIGQLSSINTNRASPSFTHDIDWYFGNLNARAMTGVGASGSWTVPTSFYSQIPNSDTGVGMLRTHTYSGSTMIGFTEHQFRVFVPAGVVPTFTAVLHTEATAGIAANVGRYVKGLSTLALEITGAAGAESSTIASYKIEVLSGTTVLHTINARTGTTPPLAASGNLTIRATVTDSRGRTAIKTAAITVLDYAPPKFNAVSVQRALSNGTVDVDQGTYLRVNINATISSLMNTTERNAMNYRVYSRAYGTTTWTLKSSGALPGTAYNSYQLIGTYSITLAYEVRVDVYDDFSTSTITLSIPVAEIFMHWNGSAGVGFGKFHENGRIDAAGDLYLRPHADTGQRGELVPAPTGHAVLSDRLPHSGTTAQRDNYYGIPAAGAPQVALANRNPMWYNTDFGWWESYLIATGTAGLTAKGLLTGTASGWYPVGTGPIISLIPSAQYSIAGVNDTIKNWAQPGTAKSYTRGGSSWFTYDNTTGRITLVKAGQYRIRAKTQLNAVDTVFVFYIGTSWATNLDGDMFQGSTSYGKRMVLEASTRAAAGSWVRILTAVGSGGPANYGGNGVDENSGQFLVEYTGPAYASY